MNSVRFSLVVLYLSISGVSSAQQPANEAAVGQQERAAAAMQHSLAAQQAAVEAFRTNTQSDSLKQQSESILRQTNTVAGITEQTSAADTNHAGTKSFFSTPWPSSSIPLAIPNVQIVDDTCQSMQNDEVEKLVQAAAKRQAVDAQLLKSVMRQESGFKPCAVSTAGAMGLMQIMPDTAEMLGLDDPFDPVKNTEAGAQFLKMMLNRYQGDVPMALGAYNAGPGKVDKAGGVPPISETMQYVSNILRSLY